MNRVTVAAVLGLWAQAIAQDLPALRDHADPAERIWITPMQDLQEAWFRRKVELPRAAKTARLYFSCDNECTVFWNGVEVGNNRDHQHLGVVELAAPAKGSHTIAVHARNTGGPAGMVLWLVWTDDQGQTEVATDHQWRANAEVPANWAQPDCDDSRWPFATEHGAVPFGRSCYGYEPTAIHVFNHLTAGADAIAKALAALRAAPDDDAALAALDAMERALMTVRAMLWQRKRR